MKFYLLIVILNSIVLSQTIETYYCQTYNEDSILIELCYKKTILQKDSSEFFSDTASFGTKFYLGNGPFKYYRNGKLYLSGIEKNGKDIGTCGTFFS